MSNEPKELTPEQEAQIDIYVEKWVKISLSTTEEPIDVTAATDAFNRIYKQADLPAPLWVFVSSSPLDAYRQQAVIADYENEIGEKKMGKLTQAQMEQVIAERKLNVSAERIASVQHDCAFSAHCCQCDSDWAALIDYVRNVLGITEETAEALPLMDLIHLSGGAIFRRGYVILVPRPAELNLGDDGVIHHPSRPSIRYQDGTYQCHFRGTYVPAEWVLDTANVDPSLALTWEDVEQRRCLAELIGWEKVLSQLKTKKIHEDQFGELLEANLPENGTQRFVKVICGTGRTFVLPVSNTAKTCLEAVAETYNVTPEQYAKLEGRT